MSNMRILVYPLVLVGVVFCQLGCQNQNLAQKQVAAEQWLNQQPAGSSIRVSGNWFSQEFGKATFSQSGNRISGILDTYEIKGVASGDKLYLTAWDSGKCYYALVLTRITSNIFKGSYTDGPVFINDPAEQRSVELRKSY